MRMGRDGRDVSKSQEALRWTVVPRRQCGGQEWGFPQSPQEDPTLPAPDFSSTILVADLRPPEP